jgi:lipoprotein-anchoring transpeptidase ErfK/SrfK
MVMYRRLTRVVLIVVAVLALLAPMPGIVSAQGSVVVQPGDTLSAIAQRNGTSVDALVAANGIASPDLLFAGQRLQLTGGSAPGASRASEPPTAARSSGGAKATSHVVLPGETIFDLSARYGIPVGAIVSANHLTSANIVYAGQRLELPAVPAAVGGAGGGAVSAPSAGRKVVVSLSSQTLRAMEDGRTVASFTISSGKAWTPTPVGRFRIYSRLRSQTMSGPGYYLTGVPHVQYFVGNYALHGAYWHNLFGTPTSHGCVNLTLADAEWLWDWTAIGTEVIVEN